MNQQQDLDDEIPHVTFSIYWGRRALNNNILEEERITIPGPFGKELELTTTFKKELGMTQNEYFEFTTGLFRNIETIFNRALTSSGGPSHGFPGIRHFKVQSFLSRLASSELYPAILVKEAIITPPGLPIGSYQVLSEIRLFLDSDYSFIAPPPKYPEGEPQGNYVHWRDIYLIGEDGGGDM